MDMQKTSFVGIQDLTGKAAPSMTQSGMIVAGPARSIVAQNSMSEINMESLTTQKISFFSTAAPGSTTHWLKQIRIAMHPDDEGNKQSVSSGSMFSQQVLPPLMVFDYD
jgi:hypothetical protein